MPQIARAPVGVDRRQVRPSRGRVLSPGAQRRVRRRPDRPPRPGGEKPASGRAAHRRDGASRSSGSRSTSIPHRCRPPDAAGGPRTRCALGHAPDRPLDRWWPAELEPAMREWTLRHVSHGGVTKAEVRVTGSIVEAAGGPRVAVASREAASCSGGSRCAGAMACRRSQGGWHRRGGPGRLEGAPPARPARGHRPDPGDGEPVAATSTLAIDGTVRSPLSKVLALVGASRSCAPPPTCRSGPARYPAE